MFPPSALDPADRQRIQPLRENLISLPVTINLTHTLESGQVFHWVKVDDGMCGWMEDQLAFVRSTADGLQVTAALQDKARQYFCLDHDLGAIMSSFPKDDMMQASAKFCEGMRMIRQPVWECLATFIGSAQKQVAHIRQISARLRLFLGETAGYDHPMLYRFPTAAQVAAADLQTLLQCGLGYRAKNLLATARMVDAGAIQLEMLRELPIDQARQQLCTLPGVGEKVANCVLLFSCNAWGAFPVDVWIDRVIRELYLKRKRRVTTTRVRDFCRDYFGEWGGYAQQYLFHYARSRYKRSAKLRAGEH